MDCFGNLKWDFPLPSPTSSDDLSLIPKIDESYIFHPDLVQSIFLGLHYNKRVIVHGLHGGGKSSHIEQVCARLKWNCLRINLDSSLSRTELVGRDVIIAKEDGRQVVEFKEGMLLFAIQNPVVLVLDEYDTARPDVLFILQQILEDRGKFVFLEEGKIITPHPDFRIFATSNTIGLGDELGIYTGTQTLNQAQLDRWDIVYKLDYMNEDKEIDLLIAKNQLLPRNIAHSIVKFATLTRNAFKNGDLPIFLSTRTCLSFSFLYLSLSEDKDLAFRLSFRNRITQENELKLLDSLFDSCFE